MTIRGLQVVSVLTLLDMSHQRVLKMRCCTESVAAMGLLIQASYIASRYCTL